MAEIGSFVEEADILARRVSAADDPYDDAMEFRNFGMRGGHLGAPLGRWGQGLWLIWGRLTDWVEDAQTSADTATAVDAMRRAAAEWLAVPQSDMEARNRYCDRWVYEECGYQREEGDDQMAPEPPGPNAMFRWLRDRPLIFASAVALGMTLVGLVVFREVTPAMIGGQLSGAFAFVAWRPGGFGWRIDAHQRREFEKRGELGVRREWMVRAALGVALVTVAIVVVVALLVVTS